MADYQAFKNRWIPRGRVDADGVYGNQCVDLITVYAKEELHTNASMYGNAIDMWTKPPQGLIDTTDPINGTDCQQGDIVILRTSGRSDFGGDGHIGICDTQDAGNVWLLEQNAVGSGTGTGRDAIGVYRAIPKSRIAGIRRPKPVAPVPQAPLWTVTPISPKQIKVNAGKQKWNLGHGDFVNVAANPITTADDNTVFTANGILHHREIPQYNYYVEDVNTPHGWNVLDCGDYTPPPAPYKPPEVLIEAKPAEQYELVTDILYYPNAQKALIDTTPSGELTKGKYFVFGREKEMVNLSTSNMHNQNQWINPRKNVVAVEQPKPVVVEPATALPERMVEVIKEAATKIPEPIQQQVDDGRWKVTKSLRADGKAMHFKFMNTQPIQIFDLEGKLDPINVQPYNGGISGAFTQEFWKENERGELVHYLRAEKVAKNFWYYGVPIGYLEQIEEVPLDINNDGKRDISDIVELGQNFIDYAQGISHKIGAWDKAVHVSAKTKRFTKGVIDGFTKRKAK